jgi:glycosyltransferase involved in cell wall biosynthesis
MKSPLRRLLYISESIIPSSQANSIQVMEMCGAFTEEGVEVMLHGYRNPDAAVSSVATFYGLIPKFDIKVFGLLSCRFGQWFNAIHSLVVAHRFKPDLIYTRHLRACLLMVKLGFPVVVELHGIPQQGSRGARVLLPRILKAPSLIGVVCITDALRKDLSTAFGYPMDRMLVAHDGARAGMEAGDRAPTIQTRQRPIAGYAGQLYAGKGMEIIAALAERCAWADFWVVGGHPQDVERWQANVRKLPNLRFTGWVPPSKVRRYMRKFDIALLPNQRKVASSGGDDIARYTSPLKLFEYMAMARPILASDLEVLREVLHDGQNAILCDPERVETWQVALRRLCDDPGLATKLGCAARADLERLYTWRARARRILAWANKAGSSGE